MKSKTIPFFEYPRLWKDEKDELINVIDNSGGLVDLSIGTVNVGGQIYKEFLVKQINLFNNYQFVFY